MAVYCKRCLNPVRLAVPDTFSNLEAVCIDLNINHNTRILCIYRPPNCNSLYSDNLCELITYFVSGSDNIVIFGDFNLPDIQWSSYSYPSTRLYQSFMDCIMENALTQHVIVPTRGTNVLDLILSTDPMVVSRVTAGDHFRFLDKVSDHSALICTINLSYVSPTLHQSQSHFDFRRADFVALKVSLSCINWHELLCDCPTIDAMLITFLDTFFGICVESVPTTKIRKRIARNYPKHITKLFTKCKYLSKHKHLPEGIQKWRAAQIGYMLAIQQYVNNRERTILESGDCAAFYKYVNSQRVCREGVAPLVDVHGDLAVTASQKAEALNSQFSSVFTMDDGNLPDFSQRSRDHLSDINLSTERVRKFMCMLPNKYSRSPDGIPSAVLKVLSYELCTPLYILFKMSIDSGTCPLLWKKADITPIYKKGDASQVSNYRPISILPAMCRLFERILADDINFHLHHNRLITDAQYGFVKGRSTELQLLNCSKMWINAIDSNKFVDTVYIDFSKAFDTISHRKLLHKLTNYGISGNILQWFSSFLCDRKQRVKIGDVYSSYASVSSGVPQGSCTGPLLFILYANDLPDSHQGSETMVCLFADDTKLSRVLSSTEYRFELQEGLNDFMNWADQWQLRVAEHKCLVLSHGNCDPPSYYLKDVNLDNVDHHKDLGVIVDDHCLFKQHVSYICKKAYCSTNVLFRCFHTANTVALIRGYKSFIRPVLEYCSTVWNPYIHARHFIGMTDQLENVQRYFTRRVYYRCKLEGKHDYPDRLVHLQLESLELRRLYNDITMVYKIVHKLTSLNDDVLLSYHNANNNYHVLTRGHTLKLKRKAFRLDVARNHFCNRVVSVWNGLPEHVVTAASLTLFKKYLRTIDFSSYIKLDRNL